MRIKEIMPEGICLLRMRHEGSAESWFSPAPGEVDTAAFREVQGLRQFPRGCPRRTKRAEKGRTTSGSGQTRRERRHGEEGEGKGGTERKCKEIVK